MNAEILVIESDESIAQVLKIYLQKIIDLPVTKQSTLKSARVLLESSSDIIYPLCFVRFNLPDGRGEELIRPILGQCRAAQIALMSGSFDESRELAAKTAGATEFIYHPLASDELSAKAIRMLSRLYKSTIQPLSRTELQ